MAFSDLTSLHSCPLIYCRCWPWRKALSFTAIDCAVSNRLGAAARTVPARISPTYITALTTLPSSPNAQPPNYTHRFPSPRFLSGPFHNRKSNKKIQKTTQKSLYDDHRQPTFVNYCRLLHDSPASSSPPHLSSYVRRRKPRARLSVSTTPTSPVLPRTYFRNFVRSAR
jgi:hypothetical protein